MFISRYKYDWVILSITLTRRVYLHSLNFWLDFSSELILLLDIWNLDPKHLFGSLQGGWSLFVSDIVFSLQIQTNKNILNVFYSPLYEPISNRNAFPSLNKILIHIRLMYFFKKDEDVSGNSHVQFIKTIHFLWNQLDGDSILQEMCRRTFTLMPDEPIELFIGFYLPLLIFCSFWQVYNTQAKHIQVRFECIDFMRKNKERFQAVSVLIMCNSQIKTCQIDLFFFSFFSCFFWKSGLVLTINCIGYSHAMKVRL